MAEQHGVVFPLSGDPGASPDDDARRSTSLAGQQIVAAALRAVDPLGAAAAERESSWRQGYPVHFRRLVEAGLVTPLPGVDRAAGSQPAAPADPARPTVDPAHANPAADHANPTADPAVAIARTGLAAVHDTMRWRPDPEGSDQPLTSAFGEPGALGSEGSTGSGAERLGTGVVVGEGARETALTIPYQGERLGGDALRARLDTWVADGVIEPGVATAVEAVLAEPDWLDLRDTTVAVLGAGAEMGPLQSLLRWGADVVGVDLPRTELWRRVLTHGRRGAGRLIVPCSGPQASTDPQPVPERCGADLLHQVDAVERWLQELSGPFVLGNYVYADGATNVRVATAVDALGERLRETRGDVGLAFLATPTDVFVVPPAAVEQSRAAYAAGRLGHLVRGPLRAVSGGRLLRRQYPARGPVGPGISDSIVPQQGPNYLLAKRIHRWRATEAAADGALVSMNVAPPTRTRSVTKNRALAAAYAGAHWFGIEVFEPATSNTLMAALLVHDLRGGSSAPLLADGAHPWEAEARQAAHGGLWRTGYDPRSALGVAALLGLGGART